jgi:hypothetical protein
MPRAGISNFVLLWWFSDDSALTRTALKTIAEAKTR